VFIEVKTRTTRDVKPAEAAVDTINRAGSPQSPTSTFVTRRLRVLGVSMW
jgi:hypothetical protein